MRIHSLFLPIALLSLLTPLAVSAQERFSLPSNRIAIYNFAGDIRVERGTGSNIVVEVTRGGRDAGQLDIARSERDGWQNLIVRYPGNRIVYGRKGWGRLSRTEFNAADDGTFGNRNLDPTLGTDRVTARVGGERQNRRVRVSGSGSGLDAHANLRVLVPEGKAIAIHLGVGTLHVSDVAGDVQIDSRSGSVSTARTKGFLRVDTGSGEIETSSAEGDVALYTGSGRVEAARVTRGVMMIGTGSGGVDLAEVDATALSVSTGSGSITATTLSAPVVKLETGSGGIRLRGLRSPKFDLHTGSGSINVALDGDVDAARVRTGSGSVTIATSRGLGTEVALDTGSGSIEIDAPVTIIEKRKSFLRGTIGDGRGTLTVGTGSGSIELR